MRWALIAVLAACGRFGFDPSTPGHDAIADGSAASSCPSFAIVCDDFESGDFSHWSRTISDNNATIVAQSQIARSGQFALDADTAVGPGGSTVVIYDQAPQISGVLAIRGWIYAPNQLTDFEGSLALVDRDGPSRWAMTTCSDTNRWDVSEGSPGGNASFESVSPCLVATWQCVELVYTFTPVPRYMLYVDDVMVLDRPAVDAAPAYAQARAGVARSDADGSRVIVDDVVVANEQIGCAGMN